VMYRMGKRLHMEQSMMEIRKPLVNDPVLQIMPGGPKIFVALIFKSTDGGPTIKPLSICLLVFTKLHIVITSSFTS